MTSRTNSIKKNNQEAVDALSDVSRLLSRLSRSRKAPSRLNEIVSLTREVARLSRSFHGHGSILSDDQENNGYGDPDHYAKISAPSKVLDVVR